MDSFLDRGRFSGRWSLFWTNLGAASTAPGARTGCKARGLRADLNARRQIWVRIQGCSNVGSRWRVTQRVEGGVDDHAHAAEPAPANCNAKLGSAKAKLKLRASLAGALTSDFLSRRTGIAAIVCCPPPPPTRSPNCTNIENQDIPRLRHNTHSSAP
jgi:hypothetical protein